MNPSRSRRPRRWAGLAGAASYVLAWVLAGAVVGLVLIVVLHDPDRRPSEAATLPPVREVSLEVAARHARCELRPLGPADALQHAQRAPPGAAARTGFYERPLASRALGGALRRGTVLIQYRSDLGTAVVAQLRTAQRALPKATIVAPAAPTSRFVILAAGSRRLLGCPRAGRSTLDALRLFRGRFVGERATR